MVLRDKPNGDVEPTLLQGDTAEVVCLCLAVAAIHDHGIGLLLCSKITRYVVVYLHNVNVETVNDV